MFERFYFFGGDTYDGVTLIINNIAVTITIGSFSQNIPLPTDKTYAVVVTATD